MMATLIGKMAQLKGQDYENAAKQELCKLITNRAQIEICCRQYFYKDMEFLENQMLECDDFGNNALHFAFRTKKAPTIDLIIRAGYGDIDHRNQLGLTPKEVTHNAQLDEKTKKLLQAFDPTSQKEREPDYVFLASRGRRQVLFE